MAGSAPQTGAISPSKFLVNAGWDDVPHLDERTKRELLEATPPYLREARTKGYPTLGAGAIYPVALEDIQVKPFPIPRHWPRGYGLDVGWNRTAAIWGARDPADGITYLYTEHYMGAAQPVIHAAAIKARGEWMRGAIDPSSRQRGEDEGKQLLATYEALGLNLVPAMNAVEPGLYTVWDMLSTGRLRVFTTLANFEAEYRLYQRDKNGKVVKKNDHLMDAMRYLVMTWADVAGLVPGGAAGSGYVAADRQAGY